MRQHPLLRELPWERSLCFTGHRPEKLPEGRILAALTEALHYQIGLARRMGFTHFYTGMADGVDYLAAAQLFRMRMHDPEIYVIGVQPCEDYVEFFRTAGYSLMRLEEMTANVNRRIVLPGSFRGGGCFARRNRLMAEHSSGVIAVCRDGKSGSMQTLRYAQRLGLAWCRLYPEPPPGTLPAPPDWPAEHNGI